MRTSLWMLNVSRCMTPCRLVINSTFGEVCCLCHLMDTVWCLKIVQCSSYRPLYPLSLDRCTRCKNVYQIKVAGHKVCPLVVSQLLFLCDEVWEWQCSETCATNVWLFLSAVMLNYSLMYTQLLYYIGTDMCKPCLSQPALPDSFLLLIVFMMRSYGRNSIVGGKKDPIEQARDRHPSCRLGDCSVSKISFLSGDRQNYVITIENRVVTLCTTKFSIQKYNVFPT